MDLRFIDDIARRVSERLPAGARELQRDLESNLRAALTATFERMDLVTREEFEVQRAVLQRTREKLEALERQMAELEKTLSGKP